MLRQAPNVILVGEIRDKETAEIAIQASITGHFVFSTLHTNDAPSSVTRLIDIGVPPYMVAASVVAVLAQRLGRRVCAKCKVPDTPPKSDIAAAGIPEDKLVGATFMRGQGCPNCNNGGYRGRVGIYELLRMTAPIRQLTFRKEPAQNIRKQACELGMKTLLQDGANKCLKGMTTLEEILSICHHDENAAH
jgi:type IV pilus assembly protein PilB